MSLRSWLRFALWELSKLAVVAAAIALICRAASSGPRCAIVGDHLPILLSPDGERLLTATSRKTDPNRYWTSGPLCEWNTRTGEQQAQYFSEDAVHEWNAADGVHVVFSTADDLQAVDVRTGTIVTSPRPANWSDENMGRLEMGDIVVFGNTVNYADLTILEASTGAVLDRLEGRFLTTSANCFRAGPCLAAVRYDREDRPEIVVWDRERRKSAGTLASRGMPLAISPDGRRIAVLHSESEDRPSQLSVWRTDPSVRLPLRELGRVDSQVSQTLFSPDGGRLLTAPLFGNGGTVLWGVNPTSKRRIRSYPTQEVTCAVFSDDGDKLALSTFNGRGMTELAVFETTDGRVLWGSLWGIDSYSTSPSFSPDGKTLSAYVGEPGKVRLFDASTGKIVLTIERRTSAYNTNFLGTPDRRFIGVRENGSVPSDEFDTIVDRVLRAVRLKPAAVEHGASWSMVGIADTTTRELVFLHEAQAECEIPLLADGGSAVAIQSGRTITVRNVGARSHDGWTIVAIFGVWLAAFLAERLVRRLRKPVGASNK